MSESPSISPEIMLAQLQRLVAGDLDLAIGGQEADSLEAEWTRSLGALAIQLREKQAIEEQLIHSQKLEMLGLLANCVAHDFNNLLGAISNALDLIGQEAESEERGGDVDWSTIHTALVALRNCSDRGRDTVRQMLSFAKTKEHDERRQLDLNDVLSSTEQMCHYSLDKRIAVNVLPYPGIAAVHGSFSQLQQALMNLCVNAQDAMPAGGQVILSVEREEPLDGPALYSLRVKDSGNGMLPEVASCIFDPFFTTKGHGTGLGLVVVKRITENHGGTIEVSSEIGDGTEFRLKLPAAVTDDSLRHEAARQEGGLRHAKAGECILLVDDEEAIRKLNLRMLAKLGYDTLAAATGEEGIALYQNQHARIDLVVLDLMLSDMTGLEVFDRLKEFDPQVKVLVISGFSQDPRIAQLLINGCEGFLKKPYRLSELSDTFRSILDP